jgi:transposase
MNTRSLRLTQAEADALQEAYRHCQNPITKTRFQAVRLYATGYGVNQIEDICGCTARSILNWTRAFQQGGLTALLDHRQGGNRAKLKPEQIEAVQNKLHGYTPAQLLGRDHCVGDGQFWTPPDLARLLEREYGVLYQSRTSYQTLLQKCGLSYQRPAKQYKSHSEAKLMDFEQALEKKTGRHRPRRTTDGGSGRR